MELSELQLDVLGELANMGLGAAAASLSEMVQDEVVLSVPKVEFIPRAQVGVGEMRVVLGDSTQLIQLIQNLVANALKFCTDAAPRVNIAAQPMGDFWQISVEDNGIGIRSDFHERIFQAFQRLHTQDEYPGTGIGLTLCKKIVERHGGHIWLDSEPGRGTRFHFTLKNSELEKPAND